MQCSRVGISPGEVDVVAPLELHLLVLTALGVHELLAVRTGGMVGGGRGGDDGVGGGGGGMCSMSSRSSTP